MKHVLLTSAFFTFLLFFSVTPTLAQYVQAAGATTSQAPRQALIEKKILNPQNNQFVDNLNFEQMTFLPGQDVLFRVIVTNVIQSDLKNLQVTDKLPDVLNFISTSLGNYDANSKTITFTIDSLKAGESKTFEIKSKVKEANEIASNVICQANLSKVMVNNMEDVDTASFCVSKQVLGVTSTLPTTGPSQTLPMVLLSSLLLSISLLIKRIIFLEKIGVKW